MPATLVNTPDNYIAELPADRQAPVSQLRTVLLQNLPAGFTETISYGMLYYVVPHSLYPAGYHCDAKQPLPFIGLASQKNFIALYHMGLYMDQALTEWFTQAYAQVSKTKLDMGKSCIRFKKPELIPYNLLGELASKLTVQQWINLYESNLKK